MSRKHNMDEVIKSLRVKKDCRVNGYSNTVEILTDTVWDPKRKEVITNPEKSFDLGNGSWGKIDFLVNHCGFNLTKIGTFKSK